MLNIRMVRRASARIGVALVPFIAAGCSSLFPAHQVVLTAPDPTAPPAPFTPSAPAPQDPKAPPTLFTRLGGMDGITAFSDDFLGRVTNDPAIIPFFRGLTGDDLKRIRQHVIELLCSATGGGCAYTGKDMKTTHKDMEIDNDKWNAFTGHLNESVAKFHVPDRERNELVVIIASLKKDIVNR